MDRNQLVEAIKKAGTPAYIFDLDILKSEADRFRRCLGGDIGVCFAMKANPFLTGPMAEYTDRLEVCSFGEFLICKELGIAPAKLYISGVLKKTEDLKEMLEYGGSEAVFTAESVRQFEQINAWGAAQGMKITVFPRLSNGAQFGIDEEQLKILIKRREEYPGCRIGGIHYFTGTQKRSAERISKEITRIDKFFEELAADGFVVPELEYGTGFAVPYFEGKDEEIFTDKGIGEVSDALRGMKWKGRITIEMGRALSALCGYYLTQVQDEKMTEVKNFAIIDGGMNQINYDGQIRGMYLPHIDLFPAGDRDVDRSEKAASWSICGSLCTFNDVLCHSFKADSLLPGDVLVFERAGAYSVTEGMALFLSHELPAVWFFSSEGGYVNLRKRIDTYRLNMERVSG